MKYLIVDAEVNTTGLRDQNESGHIHPEDLQLSLETTQRLNEWVARYEAEHYNGFENTTLIDELDQEGKEIALIIKNELSDVKLQYFSAAKLTTEFI